MSDPQASRLTRRVHFEHDPVDGQAVKELIIAAMTWLDTNHQIVNALNVFPVPDGDTGTNMLLTMKSALAEIETAPETHVGEILAKVAKGALMGARGNSGVILSQLWRGISQALEGDALLTGPGMVKALSQATHTAYKGVVKPVEGTILTVSKDIAAAVERMGSKATDVVAVLEVAIDAAGKSVEHTPELLPILKEAGVVDSGGKGFYFLLEGMLRYIDGLDLSIPVSDVKILSGLEFDHTMDEVEEGQDYEVVVDFRPTEALVLETFYAGLEEMGTSIQVGEGEGMYRMHIHVPTENLYKPIDYCMALGTVTDVAIENLMAQMEEIEAQAKPNLATVRHGQIAVISVSPGKGLTHIMASLGAHGIVGGGQTMNPSTEDFLHAFENLPTDKVIILPNNSNIVMAAMASTELTVKDVRVVKSKTIPQGIAALMRMNPDGDMDEVYEDMVSALDEVETGEITTATRDVEIDGVKVKSGEIIGLHNGKLVTCSSGLDGTIKTLLHKIGMDDFEIITLFYGKDVQQKQAEATAAMIEEAFEDIEVEVQEGGQPHYMYILSIE